MKEYGRRGRDEEREYLLKRIVDRKKKRREERNSE